MAQLTVAAAAAVAARSSSIRHEVETGKETGHSVCELSSSLSPGCCFEDGGESTLGGNSARASGEVFLGEQGKASIWHPWTREDLSFCSALPFREPSIPPALHPYPC